MPEKEGKKKICAVPDCWSTGNIHLDTCKVHASAGGNPTCSGVQKRALATGGTPRSKQTDIAVTLSDSERNNEIATTLTTADIPKIVAEVLCIVANSGDLSKDDDDPTTEDKDSFGSEDEGTYTYLFSLILCVVNF